MHTHARAAVQIEYEEGLVPVQRRVETPLALDADRIFKSFDGVNILLTMDWAQGGEQTGAKCNLKLVNQTYEHYARRARAGPLDGGRCTASESQLVVGANSAGEILLVQLLLLLNNVVAKIGLI